MSTSPVTLLTKESYLATIENSVGSHQYRNLYALVDGKKEDLVKDGALSCALFVSCILLQFRLLDVSLAPHATVAGTLRNIEKFGWQKTDTLSPGSVLVWEEIEEYGTLHAHIGFALNESEAVSNSTQERCPVKHSLTFGTDAHGLPVRTIIAIYTHPAIH